MRALVLLYYFPPSGGPGVQRGLKLCRDLPGLGIEPVVVTVAAGAYRERGEYEGDSSLAAEVRTDLRVVRTRSGRRPGLEAALQAARLFRLAQHLAPRRFFERQAGWFAPALRACLDEIEASRPDVLLTSSQPYVVHLVGAALRRRTGIPWVADFRDPWTTSWGRVWPSQRAYAWECDREDEVLGAADRVVANTPGSRRELLVRRPWLPPEKVDVVTNGYDPADLEVEPAPRDPDELLVVHSGAFRATPHARERRGLRALLDRHAFAPLPYDLSTHAPDTLFRAMALVRDRGCPRGVRARLVGPLDPRWMDLARAAGIADSVEPLGYRPHREATSHVRGADLLYLPTVTRSDGEAVSNVPAKTYEYLGSGRPIAALAGPGDVRELLASRERVRLLAPGAVEALADVLLRCAAGDGPPASCVDPSDAHPWRRESVARAMASTLRSTGDGSRAPAGATSFR